LSATIVARGGEPPILPRREKRREFMTIVDLKGEQLTDKEIRQGMFIKQPLVIMFESGDGVTCHIDPQGYDYRVYGLLICDLVRHVARAFRVDESDVWEWVDRERQDPTAEVTQLS
jgi:hypothetical protein